MSMKNTLYTSLTLLALFALTNCATATMNSSVSSDAPSASPTPVSSAGYWVWSGGVPTSFCCMYNLDLKEKIQEDGTIVVSGTRFLTGIAPPNASRILNIKGVRNGNNVKLWTNKYFMWDGIVIGNTFVGVIHAGESQQVDFNMRRN